MDGLLALRGEPARDEHVEAGERAPVEMAEVVEHAGNAANDLENRYLWRYRPQRLEAEIIRDSLLVAGGNINLDIGGEPILPFIRADILVGQFRG
jgi:hypothetical protein